MESNMDISTPQLFTITKAWLQEFKTTRGGYNKRQINELGLSWPPKEGWQERLIGKRINQHSRERFESHSIRGNKSSDPKTLGTVQQRLFQLEAQMTALQEEVRKIRNVY